MIQISKCTFLELICDSIYRQLRARRVLLQFKDVPLRTKRALLLYKVYGDSALLVLNGTSLIRNNALLALNWRYIPFLLIKEIYLCYIGIMHRYSCLSYNRYISEEKQIIVQGATSMTQQWHHYCIFQHRIPQWWALCITVHRSYAQGEDPALHDNGWGCYYLWDRYAKFLQMNIDWTLILNRVINYCINGG